MVRARSGLRPFEACGYRTHGSGVMDISTIVTMKVIRRRTEMIVRGFEAVVHIVWHGVGGGQGSERMDELIKEVGIV